MVWASRKWLSAMKETHIFGSRLFTSIVIVVYVATSIELSAAKIFPMFSLFTILSYSLMEELPGLLTNWKQVAVSSKRIQVWVLFGQ
jgi:hypothetical protein